MSREFPRRVRDWKGGWVITTRNFWTRGGVKIPDGTLLEVIVAGPVVRLAGKVCEKCRMRPVLAIRGTRDEKKDGLEWFSAGLSR